VNVAHNTYKSGPYIGFFCWGLRAAKPESLRRAPNALRGIFPPSQKLKVMPTKCTFWGNFVGKTVCSDKKAI
jgi:hypothetical protein